MLFYSNILCFSQQEGMRDEAAEPEIDIDDLLDLSIEEQKCNLQVQSFNF